MATKQSTIAYLLDQLDNSIHIRTRKMFGEYAIYYFDKVIGFVCDDELFIKPTESGKHYLGEFVEKPPYPGAKNYYYISSDLWEDKAWLLELFVITEAHLPAPKLKKKN